MKKISLTFLLLAAMLYSSSSADDIKAVLDSSDGSSGLRILNSGGTIMATIDSYGRMRLGGDQILFTSGIGLGSDQGDTAPAIYNRLLVGPTLSGLNLAFRAGNPTPSEVMRITASGNVGIGTSSPASKVTIQGGNLSVFGTTWEKLRLGQSSDNGFFSLWNSGGTQSVAINASGASYLNGGSVGIGTASPAALLEVSGGKIQVTNEEFRSTNAGGVDLRVGAGTFAAGQGAIGTLSNHPLKFYSNSIERAVITETGKVGIGTAAPDATVKLHVSGGAIGLDNSYALCAKMNSGTMATMLYMDANNKTVLRELGGGFTLNNSGNNPIFFVTNAGNAGIGTTTPGSLLEIYGTGGDSGASVRLSESGNRQWAVYPSGGVFRVKDMLAGSDYLSIIGGSGRVGIGTTSQTHNLEVSGNIWASYTGNDNGIYGSTTGASYAGVYGNGATYGLYGNGSTGVYGSGTTYGVRGSGGTYGIYGSGSSYGGYFAGTAAVTGKLGVGIASPSPSAKLQVYVPGTGGGWDGIGITSSYTGGKSLTINQGVAGKLNFTEPGVVDLMTLDFVNNRVGIYNTGPSYTLDVGGSAHATSFPVSSDIRLKENIKPVTNALEKLQKVRGVSFDWNEKYKKMGRSTGHREIGFVAQEVEPQFPELVTKWGSEEYRAIDYGRMTAVLVEAVKELKTENELLKSRLKALEDKLR